MPLKKPLNLDASVPKIDALVLMDSEGKRIAVDYFTANLYVPLARLRGRNLPRSPSSYNCSHPTYDLRRPQDV